MNVANPDVVRAEAGPAFTGRQLRQIAIITGVALAVFALFRWLPTGTNLSHMDFRVDAPNAIDFCDPSNPQFIPVVAVASPVAMTLQTAAAPVTGEPVRATVMLKTASGKPIAAEDLLVVHTRPLHLLVIDPTLSDYQHVHPDPTGVPGEWAFDFTPRGSGTYRVFGDFTPSATNRGLYANADLEVSGGRKAEVAMSGAANVGTQEIDPAYRFSLQPATETLFARVPMDLVFSVTRADGGVVPLEPVMDAYAHLVAFDETRSGFAHLHPTVSDLSERPDPVRPTLNFKITIPQAGRYVVWAQVNLGGEETFVPFWFDVKER